MRFADYGKRVVFAAFDGGEITSDAGVLLLRERARRIRLFERMAGCFTDHRDRERLIHTLPALLAQRVCGMALGYEDIIDHDTLRFDPALKLLASPGTEYPGTPAPPAGKSTLSRLEQSWETGNRRYHQMVPNLKSLYNLFVALFLDACDTPPARITLDIDATDVETHGRQENAFFHGYYEHRCFLPLYVFCGRHLLLAQLRPANIDGARGARNQIRRIVAMSRERWPNVAIVLRGDSGFARENLMRWCEGNAVDYVFGLARNDVLLKKAQRVRGKAAMAMIETGQPVRAYGDFHHITKSRTWARPRRVIAKVEHKPGHEQRCRFLVTSLDRHQVSGRALARASLGGGFPVLPFRLQGGGTVPPWTTFPAALPKIPYVGFSPVRLQASGTSQFGTEPSAGSSRSRPIPPYPRTDAAFAPPFDNASRG